LPSNNSHPSPTPPSCFGQGKVALEEIGEGGGGGWQLGGVGEYMYLVI